MIWLTGLGLTVCAACGTNLVRGLGLALPVLHIAQCRAGCVLHVATMPSQSSHIMCSVCYLCSGACSVSGIGGWCRELIAYDTLLDHPVH